MVFCPTIKNNYFSSLNTAPLIYAGIGYNNQNIINEKQYFEINGAFLNEIELKTFSSTPQNDFSYPQLDGLQPNLWLKFDTNGLITNSGIDNITLTNNGTATSTGYSIRGNNSITFNGTSQYLTGTITNISNNSFSFSFWVLMTSAVQWFFSVGNEAVNNKYLHAGLNASYKYIFNFRGNDSTSINTYPLDFNVWVHLTFIYNYTTKEKSIYRNGVKIDIDNNTDFF